MRYLPVVFHVSSQLRSVQALRDRRKLTPAFVRAARADVRAANSSVSLLPDADTRVAGAWPTVARWRALRDDSPCLDFIRTSSRFRRVCFPHRPDAPAFLVEQRQPDCVKSVKVEEPVARRRRRMTLCCQHPTPHPTRPRIPSFSAEFRKTCWHCKSVGLQAALSEFTFYVSLIGRWCAFVLSGQRRRRIQCFDEALHCLHARIACASHS